MKQTSSILKDLLQERITPRIKKLSRSRNFYFLHIGDLLSEKNIAKLDVKVLVFFTHIAVHFNDKPSLFKLYLVPKFRDHDSVAVAYARAKMCFVLDKYVEAEGYFSLVASASIELLKPNDFKVHNEIAYRIGKFDNADQALMNALSRFPDDYSVKVFAMNYQLKRAGRNPRQLDLAKRNYQYLKAFSPPPDCLIELASAAFNTGNIDEGINLYDVASKLALRDGKIKTDGVKFDEGLTLQSMDELIFMLQDKGLKPFPAFGSLLGLVREGKLLTHDKDADIGIICDPNWTASDFLRIISEICKGTKFCAPSIVTEGENVIEWNIPIYDTERGSSIDLFFFRHLKDVGFCAGISCNFGRLLWKIPELKLSLQSLGASKYFVPVDVEGHLRSIYGDTWKVPIKKWDSLISCENITRCSREVSIFFALQRRYLAAANKDDVGLSYYQKELKRVWGLEVSVLSSNGL